MQGEDLLKFYENAVNEEHYFLEAHQTRVAFYSGLVTAIIAGIGAGLLRASEWYDFAALCVGPVLLFGIATNAIAGTYRPYQRFIEAIAVRAKIEQKLGLTKEFANSADNINAYWPSEPLVLRRHIESRKMYESSDEFIREVADKGYQRIISRLFRGVQWLSTFMFIGLIALSVWKALH